MWTSCLYARSAREVQWKKSIDKQDRHDALLIPRIRCTAFVVQSLNLFSFTWIDRLSLEPNATSSSLSAVHEMMMSSALYHTQEQENIQFHELNLFVFNDSLTLRADTTSHEFDSFERKNFSAECDFFSAHAIRPSLCWTRNQHFVKTSARKKFNDLQWSIIIVKL